MKLIITKIGFLNEPMAVLNPQLSAGEFSNKIGAAYISSPKQDNAEELDMASNLICFCFSFTEQDIQEDFKAHGASTIEEKIKAEKRFGNCQCATKNPKGR